MKRIAAGIAVMASAAGPALGQEPGPVRERPRAREAARMVDAYIISNLQESLQLSDEQFAKLIPLVKQKQRVRRDLADRRAGTLRQLRRRLGSGRASESEIQALVTQLDSLTRERVESEAREYAAIDAELDPIQRGKYRVMEAEVEVRIRELMRRALARQGGRPPR